MPKWKMTLKNPATEQVMKVVVDGDTREAAEKTAKEHADSIWWPGKNSQ